MADELEPCELEMEPETELKTQDGFSVGHIVIGNGCRESFPCQHSVSLNNVPQGRWTGTQIAWWMQRQSYPVPDHFKCYLSQISEWDKEQETKTPVPTYDYQSWYLEALSKAEQDGLKTKDFTVGTMIIGNGCRESFPCQHSVSINNVPQGVWAATDIVQWIQERNLPVPTHFGCYVNKK